VYKRQGLYTDPRPIEMQFSEISFIKYIWIYGHNRSFLTALIVPEKGKKLLNLVEVIQAEQIAARIGETIADYNKSCAKYDQIVKFRIVEDEWTRENGLLNTEGNLSRQALFNKYQGSIEIFYL
jgi:long-chain acyl-CoA synthetase